MALTKPDHRILPADLAAFRLAIGASNAANLLSGVAPVARLPLLGSVAQAAGVPTGAIVERGSNANGQYTKFADGTMICKGLFSATPATGPYTGPHGTSVYYIQKSIALPVVMSLAESAYSMQAHTIANGAVSFAAFNKTASAFNIELIHPLSGVTFSVDWLAIGRWF
jgi:hypothetical protein